MATFAQLGAIASSGGFRTRVNYAMSVAAVNVYAEDPSTAKHGQRAMFAAKVARGEFSIAEAALLVLTNASIAAEADIDDPDDNSIPDSDIQFSVNSLWNLLAGA